MLQLPGIVLVFYPPGGRHFLARVALALVIQVALWYGIISALRRRRARHPAAEDPA